MPDSLLTSSMETKARMNRQARWSRGLTHRLGETLKSRRQPRHDGAALGIAHRSPVGDLIDVAAATQAEPKLGVEKADIDARSFHGVLASSYVSLARSDNQRPAIRSFWPQARLPLRPGTPGYGVLFGLDLARLGHRGQSLHRPLAREGDDHLGAVAELALEFEGAVMQLGQALGDGEAEARAAFGRLVGERALTEVPEHARNLVLGDAWARILHAQRLAAGAGARDFERDGAAGRRELDGVRQEVEANLPYGALIGPELRHARLEVPDDPETLMLGAEPHQPVAILDH